MKEQKYLARLVNYGFLSGEMDAATGQEKPAQFFAQFSFTDEETKQQKQAWFGGFKELQAGKQASQREITLKTIKALGYMGSQIAQLAVGPESKLLNTEKDFEIELEYQKDSLGSVKTNEKGVPQFRIKWVNDPENSGFKNQMPVHDAMVKIGGLNLDAEMLVLSRPKGSVNTGFNVQNNGQQNNGQQNMGQNNGQQNMGYQNQNNFQNQPVNQNVNGQQNMGQNNNFQNQPVNNNFQNQPVNNQQQFQNQPVNNQQQNQPANHNQQFNNQMQFNGANDKPPF